MATTTHLGITLVEQSQAQKEVTVNAHGFRPMRPIAITGSIWNGRRRAMSRNRRTRRERPMSDPHEGAFRIRRIPLTIVLTLLLQLAGALIWVTQLDARVEKVEQQASGSSGMN